MEDKVQQALIGLTEVVGKLNEALGMQNEVNANLLLSIVELRERVDKLEENSTLQE
jgi:hypothetical protein